VSKKKVDRVEKVTLKIMKSNPPILHIEANGEVVSSGWTDPELVPLVYVQPPPDGIYEFEFVAKPPTGISQPVITPIDADYSWHDFPSDLLGVRVIAQTNSKEASLYEPGQTVVERGVLTDEGVECQGFRSDEGRLFTLAGNLGGFQVGDRVVVVGTVAAVSFCMQGITLGVLHICKQELKASQAA
jgi:hypothetical protein